MSICCRVVRACSFTDRLYGVSTEVGQCGLQSTDTLFLSVGIFLITIALGALAYRWRRAGTIDRGAILPVVTLVTALVVIWLPVHQTVDITSEHYTTTAVKVTDIRCYPDTHEGDIIEIAFENEGPRPWPLALDAVQGRLQTNISNGTDGFHTIGPLDVSADSIDPNVVRLSDTTFSEAGSTARYNITVKSVLHRGREYQLVLTIPWGDSAPTGADPIEDWLYFNC